MRPALPRVTRAGPSYSLHGTVGHQVVRRGVGDLDLDAVTRAYVDRVPVEAHRAEVHQPVVGGDRKSVV